MYFVFIILQPICITINCHFMSCSPKNTSSFPAPIFRRIPLNRFKPVTSNPGNQTKVHHSFSTPGNTHQTPFQPTDPWQADSAETKQCSKPCAAADCELVGIFCLLPGAFSWFRKKSCFNGFVPYACEQVV